MKKFRPLLGCVALSVCLQAAQLPVNLGSAGTFTVLAGATVTNTGFTVVVGNVGVSPGSAVTGFPPGTVMAGAMHVTDGPAGSAQADLSTAYIDAAGRNVAPVTVAGDLSGQTLPPGLYKSTSSLGIAGVLTLDGQGNANSVFIFQVASSFTTGTGSRVVLIGNANPANIFWQVGSSATLGTYSTFYGTILAYQSITLTTGAILNGRALAEIGAVTLDSNPMENPGPPITTPTPPAMTVTCPLATAQVGVAYNSLLAATGGAPPYTFSTTGSLPPGLGLVPATGLLIGTPTSAGAFPFSANALDSASPADTGTNSCSITVAAGSADVSIVKSGPTTVATSTNITYNMAVTNAGPSLAASVTLSDTLPAGATFVSATPSQGSCSGTSTVSCSLGTVLANGVASVVLVVRSPSTPGTVSNTATVSSTTPDPNLANNTSTTTLTVTGAPPLTVTCPLSATQVGVAYNSSVVATGGTSPYTFSITGGSLPPGLTLLSPSTGAITGTPTVAGLSSFVANAHDSASGIGTNSCSITVVAAEADVSVIKSGPATVAANRNIVYDIVVTNAGPSLAQSVIVADILPAGTTFVSATASPAGSCSGTSTVSCSLGTMDAGGLATVQLVVVSPSTSGTVSNTAIVSSPTPDPNLTNNTSTTTLTVTTTPPLTVTCPLGAAQVGVAYNSLGLVATGGAPPYTFSITGSLPPGLGPITPSTGALTGTPTTAGAFLFSSNVQDSASPTPGAAANSCSITVVAAQADVAITKTGPTPATVAANANIAYTLTVTNTGPSPAANVIVGDILPASTTFVSATPSPAGSSCSGTTTVSCSLGTLAVGGSATIALVVRSPGTSGTVANTATVAADTLDPNLANNSSTATVSVPSAVPALSTWGLVMLALLLAGCAARLSRKAHRRSMP